MLCKFYKRNLFDHMMFAHVKCIQHNLPTVTIEKAVLNFIDMYDIDEGEVSAESLRLKYYRMDSEYRETLKTKQP